MAETPIAPGVVQNLNLASDLYGDRSNIRSPFDTGVQIYKVLAGHIFSPQRTENVHLLAGESEKRPQVGCDFVATFNWSSLLPKGFASDQFYFAVTSLALSFQQFGKVSAAVAGGITTMTSGVVEQNAATLGVADKTGTAIAQPNQVGAAVFRSMLASAWLEYLQDGRKCSYVFDNSLNIPGGGAQLADASQNGLSLLSNRAQLPVPFLLSPRNTNNSQEIIKVHFADANPVYDITDTALTDAFYAVAYRLDLGGYFCDAQGNPANQAWSLQTAAAAREYRPAQGG